MRSQNPRAPAPPMGRGASLRQGRSSAVDLLGQPWLVGREGHGPLVCLQRGFDPPATEKGVPQMLVEGRGRRRYLESPPERGLGPSQIPATSPRDAQTVPRALHAWIEGRGFGEDAFRLGPPVQREERPADLEPQVGARRHEPGSRLEMEQRPLLVFPRTVLPDELCPETQVARRARYGALVPDHRLVVAPAAGGARAPE